MESIKLKSHVGDDGVLQIQVPVGFKNEDLEVMVIFQRLKSRDNNSATLESRGWQPGFFQQVIGSWEGEPLERPEQLPYEIREELIFGGEAFAKPNTPYGWTLGRICLERVKQKLSKINKNYII